MLQLIRQTSEYLLLAARPGFARVFNKHFKLFFFLKRIYFPIHAFSGGGSAITDALQ